MSNLLRALWIGSEQSLRSSLTPKRNFSISLRRCEKSTVGTETASTVNPAVGMGITHQVKTYHKYALVWTGRFKTMEEIPERLPHGTLDTALNKARIKICIYMMIATLLMAGAAVYSGKKAAARGENLALIGIAHQKKLREQGIREEEEARVAAAAKSK